MAEDKKGIIIYADWIHTFMQLTDQEAGVLIKHFFMYVNDMNPEPPDKLTKIAFEPIKQQLKRDLAKWNGAKELRSESGQLGNLKRWNIDLYNKVVKGELTINQAIKESINRKSSHGDKGHRKASQDVANIAVNDNVTVNVTVKENNIEERKLKFASTLEPFLPLYGRELLNEFFKYWTEPNKSNTKFRAELQKTWDVARRLETWARNEKNFNKSNSKNERKEFNTSALEGLNAAAATHLNRDFKG